MARLTLVVPISLLLIFVLLFNAFGTFKQAALIIVNVPLALIGGFVAYGFLGIFFGATLMAVAFRLLKEWLSGDVQEPDLMPALSVHLTKRRNSIRMKKHS
ncbi:MAG: hypothetical protein EBZ44_07110 [Verrucomicrobia bacterium]|nr:hypothetical protein [Verrucomicrobiota bacterium]